MKTRPFDGLRQNREARECERAKLGHSPTANQGWFPPKNCWQAAGDFVSCSFTGLFFNFLLWNHKLTLH